jgi:hypothetical protein
LTRAAPRRNFARMSQPPEKSAAGRARSVAREARLAAALKRNLGRRKDQARERTDEAPAAPHSAPPREAEKE